MKYALPLMETKSLHLLSLGNELSRRAHYETGITAFLQISSMEYSVITYYLENATVFSIICRIIIKLTICCSFFVAKDVSAGISM